MHRHLIADFSAVTDNSAGQIIEYHVWDSENKWKTGKHKPVPHLKSKSKSIDPAASFPRDQTQLLASQQQNTLGSHHVYSDV